MNHLTFKEHLFLLEARDPAKVYTEKEVKNVLDRVSVALAGTESGVMTKLAKRYARLEASMKAMEEKHKELNERLKGDVQGFFDAEDVVLTRVVETAQFTLTMAKEIKKTESTSKVDHAKILADLVKLIPEELQKQVEELTTKYTKIVPPTEPVKKLSVSKEVVKEASLGSRIEFGNYKAWKAALPPKSDIVDSIKFERAQSRTHDFEGIAGTWDKAQGTGWIYAHYLDKKNLVEGFLDNLVKVKDWAARTLKQMMSWATRYDSKLDALKRKAGL